MVEPAIEVVHVGSASRDLTTDDVRGWRLGGGASYAALTTARLGLRTAALLGVDAIAADAHELDQLRDAGVDLQLARLDEGPVFENRETPSGRVQTAQAVGRPLPVDALPDSWRLATGWSLVPVAGEVGDEWTAVIPDRAYLAIGWQGMLRDLRAGERVERHAPRPSPLLRRAGLVGLSHQDVAPGTSIASLCGFLHPGAVLLMTEGSEGGQLVHVGPDGPGVPARYRPFATDRAIDATGAGDTFLAALLASILRPGIAGRDAAIDTPDLAFAAAAGVLAVEGVGLAGVPDLAAVRARMSGDRAEDRP